MQKDSLTKLLDKIEEDMQITSMVGLSQIGLTLAVLESRLWNIDTEAAQRCNDLQHKIFG
jgi:hypothetical protein